MNYSFILKVQRTRLYQVLLTLSKKKSIVINKDKYYFNWTFISIYSWADLKIHVYVLQSGCNNYTVM